MNIYYIECTDKPGILHNKTFTTKKLAIAYLAQDTSLIYSGMYGWQDKETGETVARVSVASLCVE